MKQQQTSTWLDLVFEGRHTAYGAYPMRKRSSRNTGIGFAVAVVLIFSGFMGPWLWYRAEEARKRELLAKKPVAQKKVVSYSELSAPPPIELVTPPPQEVRLKPKPSVKFLVPVAKPDEEVPDELEEMPTMDDMSQVDPGASTVEGDTLVYDEPEEVVYEEVVEEPEPEKIYTFTEQMPQFPGGEEALNAFIYEHIEYPEMAQDAGIAGNVVVCFVVASDGSIHSIEVVRGIGGGCDEEVVRVVQLLPTWEPGQQNGQPVSVQFVLPVRFQMSL